MHFLFVTIGQLSFKLSQTFRKYYITEQPRRKTPLSIKSEERTTVQNVFFFLIKFDCLNFIRKKTMSRVIFNMDNDGYPNGIMKNME